MSAYDIDAVREKYIGFQTAKARGRYPVEHDPIRRHCHMVEDNNPLFIDPAYAATTEHGANLCPPSGWLALYFASLGPWPAAFEPLFPMVPTPGNRIVNMSQEVEWSARIKVGDQLSVVQELHPLGERMLRITRFVDDKIDVQLVIWNDAAEFPDSRIKTIPPVECFGAVSACGAYLRPVRLEARGLDDPLRQGEDATIDGDDPKETRVMLGAGRDVGWSAPTCEGPEARLGPSANVLELRIY